MKKTPVFSVIIPAHNEEKFLGNCLKTILNQDFPRTEYEVIVVNNHSTDQTKKIAQQFKVKLVNEARKGVVYARQTGFLQAKGRIIVQTDADCLVPSNWLSSIYRSFKQNPQAVAVAGPSTVRGKDIYSRLGPKILTEINALHYRLFANPLGVLAGNLAVKKEVLKRMSGYNTALPHFADQLELCSRLKKQGRIYFNKDLLIQESNRRWQKRLIPFLLKDVFYYNFLNYFFYKISRKNLGTWEDYR